MRPYNRENKPKFFSIALTRLHVAPIELLDAVRNKPLKEFRAQKDAELTLKTMRFMNQMGGVIPCTETEFHDVAKEADEEFDPRWFRKR